jgi:catechol 2,3-dioxygenase-like lactoylglutathione lyase family enzyme
MGSRTIVVASEMRTETVLNDRYAQRMDCKLELVILPVSDVDRAKHFYAEQVGFHVDHDHTVSEAIRFVQLTPVSSACSIAFGRGLTDAVPGSVQGLQVVVRDIEVAYADLLRDGVAVSPIQDLDWGRFVFFADPDGNRWSVQQLAPRN